MSTSIKDVVAITGAPGLYRVIKADDKAIVVESLDAQKKRQMVRGNMMVSKLTDVSIYTDTESEPLVHVIQAIHEKYGEELPISKKASNEDLMDFLYSVLPSYDEAKVYPSNVKKLIAWYKILIAQEVDLSIEEEESGEEATATDQPDEEKEEKEA
jgi:ABC-type Na+ transport system ATPase subunit NatA